MPTRHNRCVNPACGVNTADWGGTNTFTRTTSITGMPVTTGINCTGTGFIRTPWGAITPGESVYASFYTKNRTAEFKFGRTVYVGYNLSGGGDTFPGQNYSVIIDAVDAVVRHGQLLGPAPANATSVFLIVDDINATTGGTGIEFSAMMYEPVSALDSYFDGSFPNCTWDVVAHNGPSTYTEPLAGLAVSVWNGSAEIPAEATLWNGSVEIPASFDSIV